MEAAKASPTRAGCPSRWWAACSPPWLSTPELVTTIAAIRIGALTLAVSNIFGTNCFNMLVVAAADGLCPRFHLPRHGAGPDDVGPGEHPMTAIPLLGLVRRDLRNRSNRI